MTAYRNKGSKILLILQGILMYGTQIPLLLGLFLLDFPEIAKRCFIIGFAALLLLIPVCLVSFTVALLQLGGLGKSPLKTTLLVKVGLIPWYLFNFLFCVTLVGGFLNPFLFVAIPLLICFEVGITYFLMLATGAHAIVYTVKLLARQKRKPTGAVLAALIFQFFFCLDILGAILLYRESKKVESEAN